MASIVHAADLHIDGPARLPWPSRADRPVDARSLTRQAVVRLVDLVLAEAADLLVISGDVFDRHADSTEAGRFFATQMRRLADADVPVLVAAGNHDAVCPLATGHPANVRWFGAEAPSTIGFDDLGVAVHGQGLADPVEPDDLTAGFPPPWPGYLNLGVLHTSLDGRASRSVCAPTTTARLATTGYDYWALGHVHQRRVLDTRPWLVYPGNPQGRGPHEPGPKGATLLTSAAGVVTSVAHRELAVLRWEHTRVDCSGIRHPDEALARVWDHLTAPTTNVPSDGRPVGLRVAITGTRAAPSLEQVRAAARDRPDVLVDGLG